MIYILFFIAAFMVLLLLILAAETYALSYPQDKFSKWWRRNFLQIENEEND